MTRRGAVSIDHPVDTGGLGKGLALRWAATLASAAILSDGGLLLEAGGDVVATGRPPAGGWRIAIEDPHGSDRTPVAVVSLGTGAIATSSIRVRRWTDPTGRAVHHLIDPGSGQPADDSLAAVTVAGPDPAWAEIRSKSLFLAGAEAIGGEARALGLAAWWVDREGRVGMTPAGRLHAIWVAE
jgi:thiamine biosynthesis lipoprotein